MKKKKHRWGLYFARSISKITKTVLAIGMVVISVVWNSSGGNFY